MHPKMTRVHREHVARMAIGTGVNIYQVAVCGHRPRARTEEVGANDIKVERASAASAVSDRFRLGDLSNRTSRYTNTGLHFRNIPVDPYGVILIVMGAKETLPRPWYSLTRAIRKICLFPLTLRSNSIFFPQIEGRKCGILRPMQENEVH